MRTRLLGGILALALSVTACSDSGVSQSEYDQKVAELALAQELLTDALREQGGIENEAAARQGEIDMLRMEMEQLVEELVAVEMERSALLEELEIIVGEGDAEGLRAERLSQIDAFLEAAGIAIDWLRPGNLPPANEIENLEAPVSRAGDEMLQIAFEELWTRYEEAGSAERRELIQNVAYWAIEMSRSAVNAG